MITIYNIMFIQKASVGMVCQSMPPYYKHPCDDQLHKHLSSGGYCHVSVARFFFSSKIVPIRIIIPEYAGPIDNI